MKKIIFSFIILISIQTYCTGLEIFPEEVGRLHTNTPPPQALSSTNQPQTPLSIKASTVQTVSEELRRLSLNMESLILRGDMRIGYEFLEGESDTSWVLLTHINPHPKHRADTGSYGIFGGGRIYFDDIKNGLFVQALSGFNLESGSKWTLGVDVKLGYVTTWKKNILIELGILGYRSYAEKKEEPTFSISASVVFGLDNKLFPFL